MLLCASCEVQPSPGTHMMAGVHPCSGRRWAAASRHCRDKLNVYSVCRIACSCLMHTSQTRDFLTCWTEVRLAAVAASPAAGSVGPLRHTDLQNTSGLSGVLTPSFLLCDID